MILERWKDLGGWKEIQADKADGRTVQWQKGTACHHAVCHFAGEAKKKPEDEVRKANPGYGLWIQQLVGNREPSTIAE